MTTEIVVPTISQIATMSRERCMMERMRLKNEISFARGNALWGGPSREAEIVEYKSAIDAIDERLNELSHNPENVSAAARSDLWEGHSFTI